MEQSEHVEYFTTRTEYSAADFSRLVENLREEARRLAEDIDVRAQNELEAASLEDGCTYAVSPSALAALDEYVDSVSWATRNFKDACNRVVHLQSKYDAEIDEVLGTEAFGSGAHPVLQGSPTARQLRARVTELAGRYADDIERSRAQFYASWEAYVNECDNQLHTFRDSLAHSHELDAELLSQAALDAEHTGKVRRHGLSPVAGGAVTVFTAASHRVRAALDTAWEVASAASAVWDGLADALAWEGGTIRRLRAVSRHR
ncbi:hypothetical protein AB0N09_34650 [Streptomyces erythrochromogenes]|uniref:hypothetical protein n=1 Tax=Streptomyces erythrochromogenes TaxID=285574 RepID=UPI003427FD62